MQAPVSTGAFNKLSKINCQFLELQILNDELLKNNKPTTL